MADLIGTITKVTNSFLEINQISIDNWSFKLFYKATTSILIASSVLVVSTQFFGSPIQCDAGAVSPPGPSAGVVSPGLGRRGEGRAGVLLLDVLILEHSSQVQGCLLS